MEDIKRELNTHLLIRDANFLNFCNTGKYLLSERKQKAIHIKIKWLDFILDSYQDYTTKVRDL